MPIAVSTPVRIVAPPGCNAQSKDSGDLYEGGRLGRESMRSLKVGLTIGPVSFGTRGDKTTFQPITY
jgi:hypothetical protein